MIKYKLNDTDKYISVKSFDKIPDDICKINCYDNQITILPEWTTLINLQEIYCSFNKLTILPEWTTLINLEYINCSYNRLKILPEWTLINLQYINCSNNEVTILPEWTTLINLKGIYCIDNKLTILPEWTTLINLEKIDCSDNFITILPEWTTLINLKEIYCYYNEITILPEWTTLINLNEIYCYDNQITILPEWTTLINLNEINCSSNRLTTLPVTWTRLPQLNYIFYSNNPIEYVPPNLLRIIKRQKQGQNIYNDTQSVHNHHIQECLKDSVNYLLSFKPSISDKIMFEQIKHKSLVHELLLEYSNDETYHSVLNVTFKEVLLAVWNKIIEYDNDVQDEIIKILNIEMLDSECKCFTGRLTRLVNVLNGFDENIKLQISDNEQMNNISKMLYEQYPNGEDYQRELRKAFVERGYNENDVQQWLDI